MGYISRIKTWISGETLTAADLNSEFNNCINSQIPEPASIAQGDILFRGAATWQRLGQDTKGKCLITQGASADPTWAGMTTQGDIEYHNGTTRTRLAQSTSGRVLMTKGAAQNPQWADMIPPTTKTDFYADTAPAGWTIDNTMDDKVVYITKGSAAGGQTGGAAHSAGTWTQPNHTHTGPSHTHAVSITSGGPSATISGSGAGFPVAVPTHTHSVSGNTGAGGTGATGGSATANTWRPAAYCFIVCQKD